MQAFIARKEEDQVEDSKLNMNKTSINYCLKGTINIHEQAKCTNANEQVKQTKMQQQAQNKQRLLQENIKYDLQRPKVHWQDTPQVQPLGSCDIPRFNYRETTTQRNAEAINQSPTNSI